MTLANNARLTRRLGWLVICFLVLLITSRAVARQAEHRWDEERYYTFTVHLLAFHEKLGGCHVQQRGGRPGEEQLFAMSCHPGEQTFDAEAWSRLADEGAKLFGPR